MHLTQLKAPANRPHLEEWYTNQLAVFYKNRDDVLQSLKEPKPDITIDYCQKIYRRCRGDALKINREMYNYVFSTGIQISQKYIRNFQPTSAEDIQRDKHVIKTHFEANLNNEQTRESVKLIISDLITNQAQAILERLNQ